jgi:hypothetical protein
MKYYADLLFQFLMRKKYLYKTVGYSAFFYLVYELGTPMLDKEVLPNYSFIKQRYGQFPAMILNYFIKKNASGADLSTVLILFLIVVICLLIELKINAVKGGNNNIFSGWFQINNQTNNYGK